MKKTSVIGIVAGLILVAVLYYFVMRRPAVRLSAPTLVPAESLAFLYLPDVTRSTERWGKSSIHAILEEPGVKAFLASASRESGRIRMLTDYLARVEEVKPREAFLSIQSIEGSKPQFVAGLRYDGDRAKVEALVKEASDSVRKLVPTGTADLVQRGSKTIETFTSDKATLAATYHENWYFIGSGVAEIEATLMRFRGDEETTLAHSEVYAEATEHLPKDCDSLVFVQPAALAERLSSVLGMAGMSGQEQQVNQLKRLRAVAATTRMEGRAMRDSLFTLVSEMPEPVALSGSTLRFASPAALLYYAAALQTWPSEAQGHGNAMQSLGMIPLVALFESSLAQHGVSASDLPKAIGPEIGFSLEWGEASGAPRPILAMEVRDRALLTKFIEAALDPSFSGMEASQVTENGTSIYTLPARPFGTPTLLLTDKMLAVGLDGAGLRAALSGGETLGGTEPYQEAMGQVVKPTLSTGYVDAPALFDRVYGTVRPMLIIMAAFGQQQGPRIDFGKLPEAEMISRHLGPIAISQKAFQNGVLMESAGPITMGQAIMGAGGAVAWMAGPIISNRLRQGLDSFTADVLVPTPTSSAPAPPAAGATPLPTPGYVSPVPGTVQDESVNPPLSEPTPAITPPGIDPETILPEAAPTAAPASEESGERPASPAAAPSPGR